MENGHQTVNVQEKGNVTVLGKKGLRGLTLESFFPNQDYPFADYPMDRKPWDYVKQLMEWQEKAVRVIITKTRINMLVVIKSFNFGEEDGTGDIKFSLTFEAYNPPKYTKPKTKKKEKVGDVEITSLDKILDEKGLVGIVRNDTQKTSKTKTHVVTANDTLWGLAKKYYGSGAKYEKIYNANKTAIEKAAVKHGLTSSSKNGVKGWWIFSGTKLVIP